MSTPTSVAPASERSTSHAPQEIRDHSVSPAKNLFLGQIESTWLFPFPQMSVTDQETLSMVLESVDRFLEDKSADFQNWDNSGAQPPEYIQSLRELGLFGLVIPEAYEGIGLSNSAYSRVVQQSSRYDASTSLTIGAHSSIGMKGLLLFGNDEQKARYLPRLASGELIAAFCLTESGSGSDAGSIRTHAVQNDDGTWTLDGEKIWITNGGFADFFTVFARTDGESGKLSAFLVERAFAGVSSGKKEDKMGIRASATTSVRFDKVRLPAENLLGTPGKGFKIAMAILNNGRTGLGGGCVGGMKACIELAARQADERKQFGQRIAEFGLIKEKIAQMSVDCFAAESVVSMVAGMIDAGHEDYSVEAAISKVFATEAMWRAANEALQVAGGSGYMKELPYERVVRDSRINMIFEGTNEILRLFIALSGMKDAGSYLQDVMKGAENLFNDPIKGFGLLSEYAGRRLTQLTAVGRDRIVATVVPQLQDEALIFEKYTLEVSRSTDVLLRRHGKHIIGKQFAMQRIANAVIDLFVGLCVLSRVSLMVRQSEGRDMSQPLAIARVFSQQAKRRMNRNLRRILRNEDDDMKALADFIVAGQGYPWDVL